MTLRPPAKTVTPSPAPLDPDTAFRLTIAASRQVSGNLFSLLLELSLPEQAVDIAPGHEDCGEDEGPPWDEGPSEYDVPADFPSPSTARPSDT